MPSNRFDTFSRKLSERATRRDTIKVGGIGVAGAALGVAGINSARAQEATPVAAPEISFLFVQNAADTTLAPVDGAMHTLTMTGISAQTLYFSDRPVKLTGTVPTAAFVEAWAEAFASSPPNATLIAHPAIGNDVDVAVVVTLTNPVYDEAAGSLTYDAEILGADRIAGRTFEQPPLTAVDGPQEFAEAHLFIDDASIDGATDCALCVVLDLLTFGTAQWVCGDSFIEQC